MYHIVKDIPDRKVAGVYALVDEDGKMYIESSQDISGEASRFIWIKWGDIL